MRISLHFPFLTFSCLFSFRVPLLVLSNQYRINANRGPWQLFARGPLLTRDKMSKTNLNCR